MPRYTKRKFDTTPDGTKPYVKEDGNYLIVGSKHASPITVCVAAYQTMRDEWSKQTYLLNLIVFGMNEDDVDFGSAMRRADIYRKYINKFYA